ncbi:MAG: bifunctional diguanylate cyclase/phosphodiesterase [Acetobacter sp.]|jgi:diguanylate cyclase (GGDEF)-like protein|nr:bifunctional diguanylate cyclase/phosphodiesterase [Acetobacter sp.]MCH4062127.1 bifunctional diguanylate cyclase/phosphodiesterase [Acetobacter sp.]MCH4089026.1 bifunctional diguanylate cyclase/phosphodiesterase [Acetobacter sp.]MCI1293250.1 bifunctional diguanylate cyclase/phosphodiesterase [Acetobacter sp.]MCI1320127.1 bifunctional diguanylate cyclase/phosphodiesterase [Acetobacter sp.]
MASRKISLRNKELPQEGQHSHLEKKCKRIIKKSIILHDDLTSLANRRSFNIALLDAMTFAQQNDTCVALCSVSIDRFRNINDLFGHKMGDRVLKRIADILRHACDANCTIARTGNSEFSIIQPIQKGKSETSLSLSEKIISDINNSTRSPQTPVDVNINIGIAFFPQDAETEENLRRYADIALRMARHEGINCVRVFEKNSEKVLNAKLNIEHDLGLAIRRKQLHLVYQPLVIAKNSEIYGFEALLRWQHLTYGEISPAIFIPIAEESHHIIPIGEWILTETCKAASQWPDHLLVAVNISPVQFRSRSLLTAISNALKETGLQPHRLELEITESCLIRAVDNPLETITKIREMGVRISIDDFGTGYSSLSHLQSFPFDKIKIDKSFISGIEHNQISRSIVRAVVSIGRMLNLPVVAEGVETEQQHRLLIAEGCPQAQGFLFGHPSKNVIPLSKNISEQKKNLKYMN